MFMFKEVYNYFVLNMFLTNIFIFSKRVELYSSHQTEVFAEESSNSSQGHLVYIIRLVESATDNHRLVLEGECSQYDDKHTKIFSNLA